MYTWPALELTDYEKKFVRMYKDEKFPGVLRRTYEVFMNSVADPQVPLLNQIKLRGQVQIARRARVFGLTFAGNLGSWRLSIQLASGELMTPRSLQSDGFPIVSSMLAGSSWNALSALGDQTVVNFGSQTQFNGSRTRGPLALDPNWELSPNETLIFEGTPVENQTVTATPMTGIAQKLLAIDVHVWEFSNMVGVTERMGAGPQLKAC